MKKPNPPKIFSSIYKAAAIFLTVSLAFPYQPAYSEAGSGPDLQNKSETSLEFSIPGGLGYIEESFHAGPSNKTVIYIQDAHDSLEAQENIAKIIHHLVEHAGVKTVFEEGYEGPVPTDLYFGLIPDPEIRGKAAYYLMDKLRLGGAEYAHITRTRNFRLIGADSFELHKKNIQYYQESAEFKKATEEELETLDSAIQKLVQTRFSKDLKEWLGLREKLDRGQLGLLDYLKRSWELSLKEQGLEKQSARYPAIALFLSLEKADKKGGTNTQTPQPHFKTLFHEIGRFENDYAASRLEKAEDLEIYRCFKFIRLLKRVNAMEITEEEFEAVKENLNDFDTEKLARFLAAETGWSIVLSKLWETQIARALAFYETARERDRALRKWLTGYADQANEGPAVLVYGGFHKQSIKELLRESGYSYTILTPRITAPSPRHQAYYRELMQMGYGSMALPSYAARATTPPRELQFAGTNGSGVGEHIRQIGRWMAEGRTPLEIDRMLAAPDLMTQRAELRSLEENNPGLIVKDEEEYGKLRAYLNRPVKAIIFDLDGTSTQLDPATESVAAEFEAVHQANIALLAERAAEGILIFPNTNRRKAKALDYGREIISHPNYKPVKKTAAGGSGVEVYYASGTAAFDMGADSELADFRLEIPEAQKKAMIQKLIDAGILPPSPGRGDYEDMETKINLYAAPGLEKARYVSRVKDALSSMGILQEGNEKPVPLPGSWIPVKYFDAGDNVTTIISAEGDKERALNYILNRHGLTLDEVLIVVDQPQAGAADEVLVRRGGITVGNENPSIPGLISTVKAIEFTGAGKTVLEAKGPQAFHWLLENTHFVRSELRASPDPASPPPLTKLTTPTHPVFIASSSAAGKDEFFKRLKQELGENLVIVPRYTTRRPRIDEINRQDLIYVSHQEMLRLHRSGELVAVEENYGGNLYGIPKQIIDENLKLGKTVVVVGNAHEGLRYFLRHYPEGTTVFLSPLSAALNESAKLPANQPAAAEELAKVTAASIGTRGRSDAEFSLGQRVDRAQMDLRNIGDFDHVVSNPRDPAGSQGDLLESNYQKFRSLVLRTAREGSAARKPPLDKPEDQFIFVEATDTMGKTRALIQWLETTHAQARGLIDYLTQMPEYEAEILFPHVFRVVIEPSPIPRVRLSDANGIFYISSRMLEEDEWTVRSVFHMHFGFDLLYDRVTGDWYDNPYLKTGLSSFELIERVTATVPEYRKKETRKKALQHLETIAQGKFKGLSERHQQTAARMLEAIAKGNFIQVLGAATLSTDWYQRRLAQETLFRVDPADDEADLIPPLLVRGISDPKGHQITGPSLMGLVRFGAAARYENEILQVGRDLAVPWGRERETRVSVLKALAAIGSEKSVQALMRDVADQDVTHIALTATQVFSQLPLEKVIDALVFELDHPVEEVRQAAANSLSGMGYLAIERLVHYYPFVTARSQHEILTILGRLSSSVPLSDYLNILGDHSGLTLTEAALQILAADLKERGVSVSENGFYEPGQLPGLVEQLSKPEGSLDFNYAFHLTHNQQLRYALLEYFRGYSPLHYQAVMSFLARPGYKYRETMLMNLILVLRESGIRNHQGFIEAHARHSSPQIRGAMARVLPHSSDEIFHVLAPVFLKDADWFVRKEALYGILTKPALVLNPEEIALVSGSLLDEFWVNRNLAALILRNRRVVEPGFLKLALNHENPQVIQTAAPLITLLHEQGSGEEALEYWKHLLPSTITTTAEQAADQLVSLGAEGVRFSGRLLADENSSVRLGAASVINRVLRDPGSSVPDDLLVQTWEALTQAVQTEPMGFVRAAFYNAVNAFSAAEYGPKMEQDPRSFLRERFPSEKNVIARWALLEILQIPDEDASVDDLRKEPELKKQFVQAINDFNGHLAGAGASGKISEAVLMDSSYTKPHAYFIIGSDFDLFRVVYSGTIPPEKMQLFRDAVIDLGIYLVPAEPQWVREDERESMPRSATDVTVYKDGQGVDDRFVTNDFLEGKSTWRALFFDLADKGVMLPEEIAFSKKTYRAYAMSRYYHIDTPLILNSEEDLFAFISLKERGLISVESIEGTHLAFKGNWFEFIFSTVPVQLGDKPLTISDFHLAKERYLKSDFYKRRQERLQPVSSLPADKEEELRALRDRNNVRYAGILKGETRGFDAAVLIAPGEAEVPIYQAAVESLKEAGAIVKDMQVSVIAAPVSSTNEASLVRTSAALNAARNAFTPPAENADSFEGRKILVLDFAAKDALDPFVPVKPAAGVYASGPAQPGLVWALKNYSALAAKLPGEGGVITAGMSTLFIADETELDLGGNGIKAIVFNGHFTEGQFYGTYLADGSLSTDPFAYQRNPELGKLNDYGLLDYQGKRIRIRNTDSGVLKFSPRTAARLADLTDSLQTAPEGSLSKPAIDIPLTKILYAFRWEREEFTALGQAYGLGDFFEKIWDDFHALGKFQIARAGFAQRIGAGELVPAQPPEAASGSEEAKGARSELRLLPDRQKDTDRLPGAQPLLSLKQIIEKAGKTKIFVDVNRAVESPQDFSAELARLSKGGAEVIVYGLESARGENALLRTLETFPERQFTEVSGSFQDALAGLENAPEEWNLLHYSAGDEADAGIDALQWARVRVIYLAGKTGSAAYGLSKIKALREALRLKRSLPEFEISYDRGYYRVSDEKAWETNLMLTLESSVAFAASA